MPCTWYVANRWYTLVSLEDDFKWPKLRSKEVDEVTAGQVRAEFLLQVRAEFWCRNTSAFLVRYVQDLEDKKAVLVGSKKYKSG